MHKILVVDDEKSVRYSFRKLFSGLPYIMFEAENYDSGMLAFSEVQPDLAIVDIEMPGKSGLELLKDLKAQNRDVPVIMVTAYGSSDRVIKAMKHGAFDYVEKPFEIPHLFSLIEEALKSSKPQTSEPYTLPAKKSNQKIS